MLVISTAPSMSLSLLCHMFCCSGPHTVSPTPLFLFHPLYIVLLQVIRPTTLMSLWSNCSPNLLNFVHSTVFLQVILPTTLVYQAFVSLPYISTSNLPPILLPLLALENNFDSLSPLYVPFIQPIIPPGAKPASKPPTSHHHFIRVFQNLTFALTSPSMNDGDWPYLSPPMPLLTCCKHYKSTSKSNIEDL
jgi:hypothetical protein